MDFNYQVGVFNDRATTAAAWGEAVPPAILPDDTVSPTRPDRLPNDKIPSE